MSDRIFFLWLPGTWEVDSLKAENPSATNFVGLGKWLVDDRFPDRLPLNIFEPIMLCPPDYMASFGPIPAAGSSIFSAWNHLSYKESVLDAVEHSVDVILKLPTDRPIIIGGYSQGAEVAERLKAEFLPGGRLSSYFLLAHYTFGNPGRPQGVTFPNGNTLPWGGISNLNIPTPQGTFYRSYAFYDDMYANANPKSYLFEFYDGLTDLQFHDPFKAVKDVVGVVTKSDLMILAGAQPTNPFWVVTHIPQFIDISTKAVNSLDALARFASSGAHGHYGDWEIIPGFTPIFHCIRSAKYAAKGIGYAVPGI
ncbi:endolysin [Mycobacterium phage Cuke]|uniref:Lysin B n=1 Tax=Mycobacterium phage Cuke TaxID=2079417 RepID=A0A2L1IWT3_9CAUD|nr:endolysin [Mycobacterium phage Cuke]AVD99649.1 lysin B [Mycobacterium phage Cuke]